jgi:hypothetical protein
MEIFGSNYFIRNLIQDYPPVGSTYDRIQSCSGIEQQVNQPYPNPRNYIVKLKPETTGLR